MVFVYNALLVLFLPAIVVYWLAKVACRKDYLAAFAERLGSRNPRPRADGAGVKGSLPQGPQLGESKLCFWIHAVSAGEVVSSIPFVKALQARFPRARVVLSTLTPTGRQVAVQHCSGVNVVMYCPIDFFLIVDRVISRIDPTVFLPVETDLWPTLIQRLHKRGVPCVLVNGRVSERRLRYRWLFKPVFRQMAFFCVQTQVDAERLDALDVDRSKVAITGNMKFAQAAAALGRPPALDAESGKPLLIGGSTHDDEEEQLLHCYEALAARRRAVALLLAPRHLERLERVERLVAARGFNHARWTQLEGRPAPDGCIVILDTMGQLAQIYASATAVFVGGSWVKRGGHNVMEPAAWGKPIFFGPHMENYSSVAAALLRLGGAMQVQDGAELAAALDRLLGAPEELRRMGRNARAFVLDNQGAVERNLAAVENVLASFDIKTPERPRDPLERPAAGDAPAIR